MKNFFRILIFILIININSIGYLDAQIITTFAGDHLAGNGGPATAANVFFPGDIVGDGSGNMYITENNISTCRIRKVDASGIISTIAGDTTVGYSGDGGPATAAQLSFYDGSIAIDGAGNIYVADQANFRIRKINASGIITTVCGTGVASYSGDGGPATAATLSNTVAISVDAAGDIFISDVSNNRIRKINLSGIITTIAGTGTVGFSGDGGPATLADIANSVGIGVDAGGNVFFTDAGYVGARVRKINTSGIISTVAGGNSMGYSGDGGPATSALLAFNTGFGISVDGPGNIYICDAQNNRVRKVNLAGIINTIGGTGVSGFSGDGGPARAAQIKNPNHCFADPSGNVFFTDIWNNRVRKINTSGTISTFAGDGTGGYKGDGGLVSGARFFLPADIAIDTSQNIIVNDIGNARVRKITPSGNISTIVGCGEFGFSGDGGPATAAKFGGIFGMAIDTRGNIYLSDVNNNCVRAVNASGIVSRIAGTPTAGGYTGDGGPATAATIGGAGGLTTDTFGNLLFADGSNNAVRKVNTSGIITTVIGNGTAGYTGDGGPASAAQLSQPSDVKYDRWGNLYIADGGNNVVRKVDRLGIITTIAGNGIAGYSGDGGPATAASFNGLNYITVDSLGVLYVADGNNVVRKIDAMGTITTLAGNTRLGYYGDGGPSTAALLYSVAGLAVNARGSLLIGDYYNNVIRKVDRLNFPPAFNAGPSLQMTLCTDGKPIPLDTLLSVSDTDLAQTERWSIYIRPVHGTLSGYFTTSSIGGILYPGGFNYIPAVGYSGNDSFSITVSDGLASDTLAFYVSLHPYLALTVTSNSPVCVGQTIQLTASNASATSSPQYRWTGPNGFTSALQKPTIYDAQLYMSGVYKVIAFDSVCSDSANTKVIVYPTVVLRNVTQNQTITDGSTVQLNAEGATFYYWTPSDGSIDNPNINNPLATPHQNTTYTVIGGDVWGCKDTATVDINVINSEQLHIPGAFTPNGDGMNDIFRIGNLGNQRLVSFDVYNRWGERIYENNWDKTQGWDGTWRGTPQDAGTYNFMIVVGTSSGENRVYKGTVTLVR